MNKTKAAVLLLNRGFLYMNIAICITNMLYILYIVLLDFSRVFYKKFYFFAKFTPDAIIMYINSVYNRQTCIRYTL